MTRRQNVTITPEREYGAGTSTNTESVTTTSSGELSIVQPEQNIAFNLGDKEPAILELHENGEIFVHGKKIANDIQVYRALQRWSVHTNAEAVNADELEEILKSKDYQRFYRNNHRKHKQPGQTFIDYFRKRQNATRRP